MAVIIKAVLLNCLSCNFGLKSCLWFQIELSLRTRPILKSRVWRISDQIHSTNTLSLIASFYCHASKTKNKTINSRIWEMKGGWYRKTLAKIQVSLIFHTRNILRNCLPKIIERFLWRRHVGAHLDGHQHGHRKLTETSVTEFCYERVNSSLKERINIKPVPFLIEWLFK